MCGLVLIGALWCFVMSRQVNIYIHCFSTKTFCILRVFLLLIKHLQSDVVLKAGLFTPVFKTGSASLLTHDDTLLPPTVSHWNSMKMAAGLCHVIIHRECRDLVIKLSCFKCYLWSKPTQGTFNMLCCTDLIFKLLMVKDVMT